jgi:hypothetical protein
MCQFYAGKTLAARAVLSYGYTKNFEDLDHAEDYMSASAEVFSLLASITKTTYHFANSMQTGHRKIPFPGAVNGVSTNYHWSQVLPLYEKELRDFQTNIARLKAGAQVNLFGTNASVQLNKANPEIAEPK